MSITKEELLHNIQDLLCGIEKDFSTMMTQGLATKEDVASAVLITERIIIANHNSQLDTTSQLNRLGQNLPGHAYLRWVQLEEQFSHYR